MEGEVEGVLGLVGDPVVAVAVGLGLIGVGPPAGIQLLMLPCVFGCVCLVDSTFGSLHLRQHLFVGGVCECWVNGTVYMTARLPV